ncbi:MAG: type II toxin-antitoxin system YafQ family toxin [Acutalibacteraceae bacterium]
MLKIVLSNQFKKDLKLTAKRGYKLDLLEKIIDKIANHTKLEDRYRDHALTGNYIGFRECHIQSDWLLIYRIEDDELILFLSRTGSHSDLFN